MLFENVREDIRVFNILNRNHSRLLSYLYFPGFRTVLLIRLSHWCYKHHLAPFAYLITLFNDFTAGIWLGPQVQIGPGFYLGHARGLVANPNTRLGRYCTVVQQVSLGGSAIIIGDCVNIGAGARVISSTDNPIIISDYVKVGAGAVVTKNVPSFSIVAGVPAQVLRTVSMHEIEETWGAFLSTAELADISSRLSQIQ